VILAKVGSACATMTAEVRAADVPAGSSTAVRATAIRRQDETHPPNEGGPPPPTKGL
jgi:hypothetical protein